ncbi:MAG: transposase [Akkermansia sp.]
MAISHASYTPEEKKQIILDVLSRKTTIQKIAAKKNIAPTLISLWKKQAEDAVYARFQPQPRGRRKAVVVAEAQPKASTTALRAELRKTRTKLTRTENALKAARERLEGLERGVKGMAETMGCKLRPSAAERRRAKN